MANAIKPICFLHIRMSNVFFCFAYPGGNRNKTNACFCYPDGKHNKTNVCLSIRMADTKHSKQAKQAKQTKEPKQAKRAKQARQAKQAKKAEQTKQAKHRKLHDVDDVHCGSRLGGALVHLKENSSDARHFCTTCDGSTNECRAAPLLDRTCGHLCVGHLCVGHLYIGHLWGLIVKWKEEGAQRKRVLA